MKKTAIGLALVGLLALGGQAAAVICTVDQVPAATLLLPYFEVDLNNPTGLTTLFSINNASATAILVHVQVWSDLSVPVLDFDVYLTGYDVQSINLRDIIVNGNLPQTASAGQDPTDTISPKGPKSQDINFASCNGILPPPPLDATTILYLQEALTGRQVPALFGGKCYGQNLGDNIARGYVTADTVNACSFCESNFGTGLCLPGNPNTGPQHYFGAGGVVTFQNVLWGDWFIVNSAQNFAEGSDLVHIEAAGGASASVGTSQFNSYTAALPSNYSFWGRYLSAPNWSGVDQREPLATEFAARYLNGAPFSAGTSMICWRDSKVNQFPFTCPATTANPPWYPLGDEGIEIFDEQEHPNTITGCTHSPCPQITVFPCPAETQRVIVGGASLPLPANFNFGWMYIDLNFGPTVGQPTGLYDPSAMQNWVVTTLESNGRFAVGLDAIRLDSACSALHFLP
jgi:hypothetical protein